ncbi:MAG: extracellular solute-binding protein [Bacilli bacterium]|nr:extracellular solute-binding protein [Bacilli bacterium]
MKFKTVLLPCAIAALMLVGCTGNKPAGEDLKGTYNVTLWVSEVAGVADQFKQQIRAFEALPENEGIKFVETIEGVSESSSATQVLTDVDAAADIYCFAQDQTARLIEGGALAKLGKAAADKVRAENDAGSVLAVTGGNDLYAYPLTSDNGYFMYYDKSVIGDTDLTDFEALLAKCESTSHSFTFAASDSAWYLASWFFGTGCTSTWTTDESGTINGVVDTFNSANGLIAAKGLYKLVKSTAHKDASSVSAFEDATPAAIVVSGTWDYTTAAGILGENLGVAELPKFHVGSEAYHLGSFSGNKLLGVKPQADAKRAAVLSKLALYLTGEQCQKERFNEFAWGPSNKVAQASEEVLANPALAALAKQNQYAKPQGQIHGSWWDIAKVIATDVKATDGSDAALQAALDAYAAKLADIFEVHPWGIVGSMAESGWSTNIEMTQNANGTWEITYEFAVDTEFKVRCGGDWDTFNTLARTLPDGIILADNGNLKVVTAGAYKLVVDPVALTLVITAA